MWEYCGKMALRAWGQSRFSRRAAMVFLAGFLAGLSLVFIGQEGLVQNTAFLNHDSLEGIGALEINLLWSGFCAGTLLSVLSLRYGIRGVVLFVGGILPQAFLLVPAFWLLCGWCISSGLKRGGKTGRFSVDGGMLFLILCALLGGCALEGYVNPSVLGQMFLLFQI